MERNVALIILDTVRKDYFDDFAPRLKRKSGTSFEQCRAAASWSTPSHASILTGELLHKHGVHAGNQSYKKIDKNDTFIDKLPNYQSLCITDHGLLQPTYDFDKFFDIHNTTGWESIVNEIDIDSSLQKYWTALIRTVQSGNPYTVSKNIERAIWNEFPELMLKVPHFKHPDQGASELTRIAKKEIASASEPFFLFMNYMDAHTKHRVNKHHNPQLHSVSENWESRPHYVWESEEFEDNYIKNYRELYGASIDYLDRKVLDLISNIQNTTERETTFIITADHGHNLGYDSDNSLLGHAASVSEGVLHVPLEIINPPETLRDTIPEYFSHLDLGELIIRMSQSETEIDDIIGSPIVAEHEGLVGYSEKINKFPGTTDEFEHWNRMIRVIYYNNHKFDVDSLDNTQQYLLDPSRPCFQEPVDQDLEIPQSTDEFFDIGIKEYKDQLEDIGVSDEVRDDLQDLGYL
jgi:arylsulfatase A-like enzyme